MKKKKWKTTMDLERYLYEEEEKGLLYKWFDSKQTSLFIQMSLLRYTEDGWDLFFFFLLFVKASYFKAHSRTVYCYCLLFSL